MINNRAVNLTVDVAYRFLNLVRFIHKSKCAKKQANVQSSGTRDQPA
jgi:hypothetical protein